MGLSHAKIDWNAFCFLFSPDPRTAFQQLTEQLFCFEFRQPYGVYRYYNQPYIETMPVHHDGTCIGFQAKYYDESTKLSDNKDELIASITGARRKYSDIDKIIFYINKEPGISSTEGKEKPTYIDEVEAHGNAMGVCIEWRGLNQMETMLLLPELEYIRDYFFATNGGIKQFLTQIELHTKSIFDNIASDIPCGDLSLKLSRAPIDIDGFLNSNHDILLVHGEGGYGKSALIKDHLGIEERFPVWCFRATDFNMPSLPEFTHKFGNCSWNVLLSALDNAPHKLCIIDSGEKVFTIEHNETFEAAIRLLREHGWKLIISIRTSYKDNFINTVLRTSKVSEHTVQKITIGEMSVLEKDNKLSIPTDAKLRDFLCNLFYLKLYLSNTDIETSKNVIEFLHNVWEQVICNSAHRIDSLHVRRGRMICCLVRSNADKGTTYYVPRQEEDWEALTSLANDGIIQHDDTMGGYFVTHDVYEEIVLKHIISIEYNQKHNSDGFFMAIGDSLVMRKAFRLWLHNQFENTNEEISGFLSGVLSGESGNPIWKDEILIALMAEERSEYTSFLDAVFKENGYQLFIRAIELLNTSCKTVDDKLWQQISTKEEAKSYNIFRFTKPSGLGWTYLIPYAYSHREQIPWTPIIIMLTADALHTWTRHVPIGETTRSAGLMALYLYQLVMDTKYHYHLGKKIGKIIDAVFNSAKEIIQELTIIFEDVLEKGAIGHRELYTDLCEHLLSNTFNCGTMCVAKPELVLKLAKCFWLEHGVSNKHWYHTSNISAHFGLREHMEHEYYPESAFQTPIFALLQAAPIKTIDFIIELFDIVAEAYKNSSLNIDYNECSEIEIVFPNGDRTVQVASNRLWLMYRGTSVTPNLLESILMALERWLYFWIPEISEDVSTHLCSRLLSKSHSAAITAVVTSMVTAFPDKLFSIACILLHTKEIFLLDIPRLTSERGANFLKGIGPSNKIYDDERIHSNTLLFRKKRLEDIILGYQLNGSIWTEDERKERLQNLYKAIDEAFHPVESLNESEQFVLYRIDLRKMKLIHNQEESEAQIVLVSDLPENLVKARQELQENTKNDDKYIQLFAWSHSRFDKESDKYQKYIRYETDPQSALTDALSLFSESCSFLIDKSTLICVSAVLLIDFKNRLDEPSIQICTETIMNYFRTAIEEKWHYSIGDGADAAIAALPILIERQAEITLLPDDPIVMMLMLICGCDEHRDRSVKIFREKIWHVNPILARNMLVAFILLKPEYDQKVSMRGGISPFQFIETNNDLLNSILKQQELGKLPDFRFLNETALQTLNLLLPTDIPLTRIVLSETGKLFWPKLFEDRRHSHEEREFRDWKQERTYFNWLAEYLLCATNQEQRDTVLELASHIVVSDMTNNLLTSIIMRQDQLMKSQAFWNLWDELFKIIEELYIKEKDALLCIGERDNDRYYGGELDKIITTYLLAFPWWQDRVQSWHTLCDENANFFAKAATRLGYHPGTLYSVARVLNTIGYNYLDQGIMWLATIVRGNPHLRDKLLEVNTEYYIEEYVQRFISSKRTEIKRSSELRRYTLDVLNFLVDRGSTCGFMLRESIC